MKNKCLFLIIVVATVFVATPNSRAQTLQPGPQFLTINASTASSQIVPTTVRINALRTNTASQTQMIQPAKTAPAPAPSIPADDLAVKPVQNDGYSSFGNQTISQPMVTSVGLMPNGMQVMSPVQAPVVHSYPAALPICTAGG